MQDPKQAQRGVIIAADHAAEHLLPWWWKHYQLHSSLPVILFDLGLSDQGRAFAHSFATILPFTQPLDFIAPREAIIPEKRAYWETHWTHEIWGKRKAWFSKPFVLMESPFEETLFLDIDCRVQGDLMPLFDYLTHPSEFTIVKHEFHDGFYHNSGVCGTRKGSPILKLWSQECILHSEIHMGDEDALHHLILEKKLNPSFSPLKYNHPYLFEGGEIAIIQHFLGKEGKQKIFLDL